MQLHTEAAAHRLSAASEKSRSLARWRVVLLNPAPSTNPPPLPPGKSLLGGKWAGMAW